MQRSVILAVVSLSLGAGCLRRAQGERVRIFGDPPEPHDEADPEDVAPGTDSAPEDTAVEMLRDCLPPIAWTVTLACVGVEAVHRDWWWELVGTSPAPDARYGDPLEALPAPEIYLLDVELQCLHTLRFLEGPTAAPGTLWYAWLASDTLYDSASQLPVVTWSGLFKIPPSGRVCEYARTDDASLYPHCED